MSAAARPLRNLIAKSALRIVNTKHIEPIDKWHITKGDLVQVLSGRSAGKTGKVLRVRRSKNRVIVEGLNMVSLGV
jgi:transcription antitermination factor NusG